MTFSLYPRPFSSDLDGGYASSSTPEKALDDFHCYTFNDSLPVFQCRPSLLNANDCMQIMRDCTTDASTDFISHVASFFKTI